MSTMIKIASGSLGISTVRTRLPFRFGVVTMTSAASATLELEVSVDGKMSRGWSSDLLAYKWFDKRPEKSAADNVTDLIWVIEQALAVALDQPQCSFFDMWQVLDAEVHRRAIAAGFNYLGASFGVSMIERAMLDAIGRGTGQPFHALATGDVLGLDPASIFPELKGASLRETLPSQPLSSLALRHTVGLVDPIDEEDLPEGIGPNDGLPITLSDYLQVDELAYLKVKVGGDTNNDLERLRRIAGCLRKLDRPVRITLDGNEQYKALGELADLVEAIRSDSQLSDFYDNTLFIEQPLERSVALSAPLDQTDAATIGKPLLIDEADGWTSAYREAIDLGYRGVSHKNCKGVVRSLLNAMLVDLHNRRAGIEGHFFQSAEDLTCLPVVSLQSDLAVVAALGIAHVERNGHHYFHGLDHLTPEQSEAAVQRHPDLYRRHQSATHLHIASGRIAIESTHIPGLGFAVTPDMSALTPADQWSAADLQAD
ncbi:mandelate racemase [Devosia pacifica]|uniref:Mandelate racemase n=1 Tax=Devosia pacifica TaxID=1335967 RepID=A0A918VSJ9_9HYPH|nr:mandelate racemase [Devosia pacifica]GHA18929.1 mandelate racemase [Devosia pacifica]